MHVVKILQYYLRAFSVQHSSGHRLNNILIFNIFPFLHLSSYIFILVESLGHVSLSEVWLFGYNFSMKTPQFSASSELLELLIMILK